jgi:hypothetical protein
MIGFVLKLSKQLTVLNLHGCKLTETCGVGIAEALRTNKYLREIDLSGNDIKEKTVRCSFRCRLVALEAACGSPSDVHSLTGVTINHVETLKVVALGKMLCINTTLWVLNLSGCVAPCFQQNCCNRAVLSDPSQMAGSKPALV